MRNDKLVNIDAENQCKLSMHLCSDITDGLNEDIGNIYDQLFQPPLLFLRSQGPLLLCIRIRHSRCSIAEDTSGQRSS